MQSSNGARVGGEAVRHGSLGDKLIANVTLSCEAVCLLCSKNYFGNWFHTCWLGFYACLHICALLVFCNTTQSCRKVFRNGQAISDRPQSRKSGWHSPQILKGIFLSKQILWAVLHHLSSKLYHLTIKFKTKFK